MKLFQKVKEIRSKEGTLHFTRFAIFETDLVSLYVHRIYKEDQDLHLHSHPWNFTTMVLWGSYCALTKDGSEYKRPLTFSHMTRNDFHKIYTLIKGPVTTLFLTYGTRQPWHYMVNGVKVESNVYRVQKNSGAL